NGYAESFSALLELLDNQRFARGVPPDEKQLAQVMVRRLKSELPPHWDGTPRFPPRQLEAILVAYTDEERQAHGWLQQYTQWRRERAKSEAERTATEFVLKLLKKRLFSSPAAFAKTLAKHQETLNKQVESVVKSVRRPPKASVLLKLIKEVEEEYADDEAYEEATDTALRSTTQLFRSPRQEEMSLVAKMREWAERASLRPDSKARRLLAWIKEHLCPNGQWLDERVIIFTEYRETQKWLQGLLAAARLTANGRLMVLYGGMDEQEREAIKAAFQAHPSLSPVRILLATDAASEGIDLQRHCNRLIHVEIPWNPNRMEQRNGRIDRHGQKKTPFVFHFAPQAMRHNAHQNLAGHAPGDLEGDLEFLMRAVQKVEQIRQDLGKVGPVIADQVRDAMLGRRQRLETKAAEQEARGLRSILRVERELQKRIKRLHERLLESRQSLNLTPENVQSVVDMGLALAGQPPLQEATLKGVWPDPHARQKKCPVFHLPPLRGSWARATEGLAHPHTGELRPIVFDHSLAQGRDDVVLAHLNHPLVQLALYLLRAEVWGGREGALHRVTAQVVPNHLLEEPVVIAHGRLVVIGGDSYRLHEEIISAGGRLRQGRFRRFDTIGQMQRALDAASHQEASSDSKARFQALWPKISRPLDNALDARMRERTASLQKQLQRRADKETGDMRAILQELKRTILEELAQSQQYVQLRLDLFSTAEREQYHRNVSALERRLAQIPHEIEQEEAQIRARYANPQPRLFPVAVTFLVPQRFA
ncbi:MAG: DISARM system SNF2-like helicase DrmD, partial [Ardenticatenaceae bacterium]